MNKQNLTANKLAREVSVEPSKVGISPNPQIPSFVPTEDDASKARARMRPEIRKAYEKSLKQYGGAYKRLADM